MIPRDLVIKIIFAIAIFLCGFIGVLTPRVFDPYGNLLSTMNLFSSGVLLAAGLVHLLGDAASEISDSYPLGYFLCGLSFYFFFVFERLIIRAASNDEHQHSHSVNDFQEHLVNNKDVDMNGNHTRERNTSIGSLEEHGLQIAESLKNKNCLSAVILLGGLGLHSFLAGLAMGASDDIDQDISLGIAIIAHKYLAAVAIGVPLCKINIKKMNHFIIAFAFGIITPSGIMLGYGIANDLDGTFADILVCIASGTFVYVAICEIMVPEYAKYSHGQLNGNDGKWESIKTLSLVLGYGLMSLLAIWV